MERTSVNLESLKGIPGYKVILKTVLHSQIQQLVQQLSQHTEEEAIFLTASLGDGTISHIGSGVGKEFLQENDNIKSHFLSFCLKRQHQVLTSQISVQTPCQRKGPFPVKLTGSSPTVRHSPYSTCSPGQKSRRTPKIESLQSSANQNETSDGEVKILETVKHEEDDDNDNAEHFNVTENGGISDVDNCNVQQKSNIVPNMHIQERSQCKGDVNIANVNIHDFDLNLGNLDTNSSKTVADNGALIFDPDVVVKIEQDKESGSNLNSDLCSFSGATGINSDLQGNDCGLKQEQSEIGQTYEDWSPLNRTWKEIRNRKRKGEIPVYANITPTQTKCPYCEQNYANNANLKRHIRKHEGIYPYQCQACERKFTDPTMYKRHVTNTTKSCGVYYSSQNNDNKLSYL